MNISHGLLKTPCYNSRNQSWKHGDCPPCGLQAASLERKLTAEQEACAAAQRQLSARRQQQQQMLAQLEGAAGALQESQTAAARLVQEKRQLAQGAAELRRQLEEAVQLVAGKLLGGLPLWVVMCQEEMVVLQ